VSETEQAKRERVLRTQRRHTTPPPTSALVLAGADPIDAPFKVLLAHESKWSAPRGTTPTSVVIHCTAAENPAASTAAFFHSPADSGSTQAIADDFEGFTMVPDDAVCAGAPPFNQEGLHIEQPGLTTWTREKWLSHDVQLQRVARHVAAWCLKYDIPVVLLHTADLKRLGEKARGITYHAAVSEAFRQSTHTDPEPNYPWDVFMAYVKAFHAGKTPGGDDEMAYAEFCEGMDYRRDHPDDPMPKAKGVDFARGWTTAKLRDVRPATPAAPHDHPFPAGRTGKNG
jgi:hypothetical protein